MPKARMHAKSEDACQKRGCMPEDPMADSSKIVLLEEHENRYWTEHLGVTREELQRAVDEIGHAGQTAS
jgi:Protein of unknown function (DUF3606)